MRIRKQIYELTPEDLELHPVWEYALDEEEEEEEEGQDEATVRPRSRPGPADPSEGMCIVRANFVLADGSSLPGYLTPPGPAGSGLDTIQPQIVTPRGQVSFWFGILKPDAEQLEEQYSILGREADKVFPLRFSSQVEIVGGKVEGILNSFLYLTLEDMAIHEIR